MVKNKNTHMYKIMTKEEAFILVLDIVLLSGGIKPTREDMVVRFHLYTVRARQRYIPNIMGLVELVLVVNMRGRI